MERIDQETERMDLEQTSPPRLILVRRIAGLMLIVALFGLAFIAEGANAPRLILAMFVAFPFPLLTIPYLAVSLCLLSKKKIRKLDMIAIITCVLLLLSMGMAPPLTLFFTPILVAIFLLLVLKRG
jgi:hypothetical protein